MVWEAAKALHMRPSEVWALPRSELEFIFTGLEYDAELKAKQGGVKSLEEALLPK